ncbi:DUF4340 domain-containing protein [Paenibacillus silviterrae]|uniref:DUF4340 domain-containing protein n=1 Tax=Paenibacillus silviterrae TaxID=3242194 RepID=UPI0025432B0E|nr:DUF4340 domain-containing protein [Paenibacillus chinjuensis]
MKRLIPTFLLVVLCIGGFWYASSKDFFKEKKEAGPSLAAVKKEEVVSYTIITQEGTVEMQQSGGNWSMLKPSDLPLNNYSPQGWVDSFAALTKEKTVDENPTDLAQFGLDKPKREFTVQLTDGTKHTLSIGDPVAIQGYSYAKFSGSPEVFRISDSSVTPLAKQPIDFMEKSPVKLQYDQVQSMSLDWKGEKWSIVRAEADKDKKPHEANWKLGEKELKGTDASQYLDQTMFLSTEQLVKKASEVKLDPPDLKLEIKEADAAGKEAVSVYTGKSEGDLVWIAKQGGEWAYAVPLQSIQDLADLPKKQEEKAQ